MVEKHYVSLFEGLDREISDKLGFMREDHEASSKRSADRLIFSRLSRMS
jgi:hypothetical protein